LWFWFGVTLLGLLMAITGLVLDFPYFGEVGSVAGTTRYQQQWANILHLLGATAFTALAMGHIYIGTAGTPGTYRGMRHGWVDEAWARHHHEAWYEEVVGEAAGTGQPEGQAQDPRRRRPAQTPPIRRPDLGLRPTE